MIYAVIMVFVVCLLLIGLSFKKFNKSIDGVNKQLDEKIKICTEFIESQKAVEKKVNNVATAVNKLKRDIDKIQNALTIFNNGFDGIQSTM